MLHKPSLETVLELFQREEIRESMKDGNKNNDVKKYNVWYKKHYMIYSQNTYPKKTL